MIVGVPRELKIKESRVACTPAGARMLINHGHRVLIETGAGLGCGYADKQYETCGCEIVSEARQAWSADMVLKVKEPIPQEYPYLREDLILFTFLHLAANRELTDVLCASKTTAIAYETVQIGRRLPLLEPMSEIAGRMSALVGAYYLSRAQGGKGVLLGGVPGVLPGKVLIIGGGTSGINAGRVAAGMGADVTILDVDLEKMRFLDISLHGSTHTLYSNEQNLLETLPGIDLLIGAVLLPGARAPKLITREMLRVMKPGSVFVDIAIDQGGCAETSRATTHDDPVFLEEEVIHYCVANMPGAYARTATQALTNVTIPYALKIADHGFPSVLQHVPELISGINIHQGAITSKAVAESHDRPYKAFPLN
ncbi:alanine dehydrogenase [Coraliomargarita parva]|uniref:alanine dehydrogenase n=1 Tax=Coraliomargarita parva TaxID=3014050 RepID=UPI0022B3315D|nr:alanine dehydrogenase [Coraliomargarita parva]